MNTFLENFIVISGSGQNSGKTTFCCRLIENFSAENRILALKITNHFHNLDGQKVNVLHRGEGIVIAEETDTASGKDTSRFLAAGADSAFLVMTEEDKLFDALQKLNLMVDLEKNPVIVESGYLLEVIKPGISGFITTDPAITLSQGFDFVAHFSDNAGFDIDISEFSIYGNKWRFH
jgi:molybdopterin-guanine dinucleotide biosynthesis protein